MGNLGWKALHLLGVLVCAAAGVAAAYGAGMAYSAIWRQMTTAWGWASDDAVGILCVLTVAGIAAGVLGFVWFDKVIEAAKYRMGKLNRH